MMNHCLFATDLHGHIDRYQKLFQLMEAERPAAVFLGGDLLAAASLGTEAVGRVEGPLIRGFIREHLAAVREVLGAAYPAVFVILGNDDPRLYEDELCELQLEGLWTYVHGRNVTFQNLDVYGYAYIPPTPFRLKDWERYDVSRFVDPGCTGPEEGTRSVPHPDDAAYGTIRDDLADLIGDRSLDRAVFLFHGPPYKTKLDRAALDGKTFEHVPLDVHVGSIAVRRMIESQQPLLTLHGHVHESTRLTGSWRDRIGRTQMFNAAHDGPELSVVRFHPDKLDEATRELV